MDPPVLRLFVSGHSPSSVRARENLVWLRSHGLPADWSTEVIDVLADPGQAEQAGILATPTLSYEHAAQSRRIVGDLGDAERVLHFLGLEARRQES